ncbi:MAG: gfo/Idh/MocA family oxidoreductase [Bacillota bacterium]|nr:MAG: gfo/Idh/MocA family oxidoreductase [Bacillota bacterium]
MKKVIAVVGCGRIAQIAHFPAFAEMDEIRVKYACDLIEKKAQAMKDKYPDKVENVITDYKVALADKEVDAVYVLTPNYAHYTVTMDALKAGKHVFCEKPITVNYALSEEMAKEAEKQGKILNIGVCNRYHKSVEMLEQYRREGKFGNIYHVYCSFRSFRSIPGLGGPFTDKKQSGGGVLIDWGVHFLDLIFYILGGVKIKNLTCDAYNEMAKDMKAYNYKGYGMWAEDTADIEHGVNDVDDFITGYVRTDKASISFNGAWAQNINQGEMFIDFLGDKGGARLTYGGKFTFTSGETLETVEPEYDIPNMYLCESKAFIESIATGVKNRSHIDSVLETAKLLDALYVSAGKREEVKL